MQPVKPENKTGATRAPTTGGSTSAGTTQSAATAPQTGATYATGATTKPQPHASTPQQTYPTNTHTTAAPAAAAGRPVIGPQSSQWGAAGQHASTSGSFQGTDTQGFSAEKARETAGAANKDFDDAKDQAMVALTDIYQQGIRVAEDARALLSTVDAAVGGARTLVREQIQARPYATLGTVAGVGYVLGGGLGSSLTRLAFKIGSRALVTYVVKEVLQTATDTITGGTENENVGLKATT